VVDRRSGAATATQRSHEAAPPAAAAGRRRLVVATRSAHKLRELRELLHLERVDLVSLDDLGVPGEPEEDGASFEANAAIKARFAARATGLPALADDSGIEVDALGGGPGVRTRRYAGPRATDADNNAKLLLELGDLPPDRRGARYVCALALALPDAAGPRGGQPVLLRRGTCRGRIGSSLRGTGGFGYDPLFEPAAEPPGGRTLGLYSAAEKHAISHRAQAARRMARLLHELGF
jgi:XTP/dITP diphosphohydrolase